MTRIRVVDDNSARVLAKIRRAVDDGLGESARRIVDGAERNVASRGLVDTGGLASSGEVIHVDDCHWLVTLGDDETASLRIEFGTRHQPARPVLGPAAVEERPNIARRIKDALG